MRTIQKGHPPNSLTKYWHSPEGSYDGLPTNVKDDIRTALLREQGYICCYCMSRIASDATRIEHWHSQHHYDEQLDYTNMLAACHGNEGRPREDQHCDVSKRDLDLDFNPANPAHDVERRVNYDGFGRITSSDAPFSAQINDVLNLNYCRLRWNRRAVVHAVIAACGSKRGTRSKRQIERLISSWSGKDSSGCYKEYCGVAIHWLRKRLRRC